MSDPTDSETVCDMMAEWTGKMTGAGTPVPATKKPEIPGSKEE
jgi:hypothetical protein